MSRMPKRSIIIKEVPLLIRVFRSSSVQSVVPKEVVVLSNTQNPSGLREQKKAAEIRPFSQRSDGYFFFSAFFFFGSNTFRPS